MNRYYKLLVLSVLAISTSGCIDIVQTIEISKDNILKSFIRVKAYIKNEENKNRDFGTLTAYDYPELKIKQTNISKDNYFGVDMQYSIPISKLKTSIPLTKKQITQPPYMDKKGQLIFVFQPDESLKSNNSKTQTDNTVEGILGMFSYKIFFSSDWKPISAKLITINDSITHSVEIVSTGSAVLIDLPMRHVIAGSILTISKVEDVDLNIATTYISQINKEKELELKKKEAEKKKQNEEDKKRQEEYEKEEAKREEEQKKQQKLDDSNDGEGDNDGEEEEED